MSENHRRIGSAWTRDHDKRMADEFPEGRVLCDYPTILGTPCSGKVMERHHVIELSDGGNRFGTRPACERHHKDMTDRNRDNRKRTDRRKDAPKTGAKTGGKAGGTQQRAGARGKQEAAPPRAQPSRARARRALMVTYLFACAAALWFAHNTLGALVAITALYALATLAAVYIGDTSTRRALARRTPGLLAAQYLPTEPSTVRSEARSHDGSPWAWQRTGWFSIPRATRLTAGRVHYWFTVDDSPGSASITRIERIFWLKLHAQVQFDPEGNYFDWWRVEGDAEPDPSPAPSPDAVIAPAPDPLAGRLVEDLNEKFKPRAGRTFTVKITLDDEGPLRIVVDYPAGFGDDQAAKRAEFLTRVITSLDGVRYKPTWMPGDKRVILDRRPPMPEHVYLQLPDTVAGLDPMVIPWGIDENHDERALDLRVHPHGIVAGPTGTGKSFTMFLLIYQLLLRGYQLILIDGKGSTFNRFRGWPGVIVVGLANDPEAMAAAMLQAEALALWRYDQVIEHGVDPKTFPPVAVLWDELTASRRIVEQWWDRIRQPRNPNRKHPALTSWETTPRTGREAREHMVVGIQQANAGDDNLGDTEVRGNLPGRLALGPTDEQSAKMMFDRADVGRDVPEEAKGRGTIKSADKMTPGVEIQTYEVPAPQHDGTIAEQDKPFMTKLMSLIAEAQKGMRRVILPAVDALPGQIDNLDDEFEGDGTSSGRRPGRAGGTGRRGVTRTGTSRTARPARTAPSKRPPRAVDEWDLKALAGAVHAYGKVQVMFPDQAEPVIVTEVGEDVDGRAQVTYRDGDGQLAVEGVEEDAIFTRVRPE